MKKIGIFFLLIFLLFIMIANFFLPRNEIVQAKLNLAQQPWSVESHLKMAELYFNNNYLDKAGLELNQAKNIYQYFAFLDLNGKQAKQIAETEKIVSQPEQIKLEVKQWEKELLTKPSYRDIFLRLAVLNYELYESEKAQAYWEKAFLLDPNGEQVQKIGELINN